MTLPMDTPIMTLLRAAPPTPEQSAFNKTRWRQLNQDPKVNRLEWRIETDRHGRMIITPPPHRPHSKQQGQITIPLSSMLGQFGTVHPECPISTSDGVKAADVAWISQQREAKTSEPDLFDTAPEICVEVISPSNTEGEMEEKKVSMSRPAPRKSGFVTKATSRFMRKGSQRRKRPRLFALAFRKLFLSRLP